VAARKQAAEARRTLELPECPHPPAAVRRRRRFFSERLAQAEAEERRLLEQFAARPNGAG